MAKQHHVNVVRQSVRNRNFSREQRSEVAPDLSGAREQIQHVTLDPETKRPAYLDF